jgi:hypothetical protein
VHLWGFNMLPDPLKRVSVILVMSVSIGMTALWICLLGFELLNLGEHEMLLVRDLTGQIHAPPSYEAARPVSVVR